MAVAPTSVTLRPTTEADIDFVRALEARPENQGFIGRWSHDEHAQAIARGDCSHWIIVDRGGEEALGFLIMLDGRAEGGGVYLKRVAVTQPSRGVGRAAVVQFLEHAFGELGATDVRLTVVAANEVARRLYDSLGFAPEGPPREDGAQLLRLTAAGFRAGPPPR